MNRFLPARAADPLPACGAADDRGHPIRCEQCIWGGTCLDSTCRPDPRR